MPTAIEAVDAIDNVVGFARHYDHWGYVAIVIVVASWILYRFAAPKGWREWAGAGLTQAFIIALYAEMYGFPLTIYLLTGFFHVDVPLNAYTGHLWASLLGYGSTSAAIEMLMGGALVLFGLWLLIGGWREVYEANQEKRLASDGLYSVVRHPQYSGIMVAIFGQIVHWPTAVTLALFPVIVIVYVRLARKEERELLARFGAAYRQYSQRVPMFFPRWGQWGRLFSVLVEKVT